MAPIAPAYVTSTILHFHQDRAISSRGPCATCALCTDAATSVACTACRRNVRNATIPRALGDPHVRGHRAGAGVFHGLGAEIRLPARPLVRRNLEQRSGARGSRLISRSPQRLAARSQSEALMKAGLKAIQSARRLTTRRSADDDAISLSRKFWRESRSRPRRALTVQDHMVVKRGENEHGILPMAPFSAGGTSCSSSNTCTSATPRLAHDDVVTARETSRPSPRDAA